MPRPSYTSSPNPQDQQLEVLFDGFETLDTSIFQGEINLIAHYFGELLNDFEKGQSCESDTVRESLYRTSG